MGVLVRARWSGQDLNWSVRLKEPRAAERAGLAGNDRFGSFATDRWSPKIAPCPLFPESDAKSEPWHPSRGDTGVVAVSPCNVPL